VAEPLAGASHVCRQSPQLLALCWVSTQLEPHFWKPSAQEKSQVESLHSALPWLGLAQAVAQSPQWVAVEETSRHAPLQLLRLASQLALHWPPEHTRPASQAFSHSPQFCGSLSRSTQRSPQPSRPDAHVI
jgi:hypothetical protein